MTRRSILAAALAAGVLAAPVALAQRMPNDAAERARERYYPRTARRRQSPPRRRRPATTPATGRRGRRSRSWSPAEGSSEPAWASRPRTPFARRQLKLQLAPRRRRRRAGRSLPRSAIRSAAASGRRSSRGSRWACRPPSTPPSRRRGRGLRRRAGAFPSRRGVVDRAERVEARRRAAARRRGRAPRS